MSRPMVSDPIGHVTASAQIVDLSKSVEVRRQRLARREWQRYVWGFYRTLPEVRYPANYIGNALSRFTMRPALLDPDSPTADPRVPESKNRPAIIGAAEDILAGLQGPQGGIGEIQRRYGLNMNIAADGYLFAPPAERGRDAEWEFLSTNELRFTEWRGVGERAWRDPLGSGDDPTEDDLIPDDAYLRRFWYSHPEYSQQADGPLEALKDDCQRLLDLNDSISGRILSRLASAGILFIPNSISMPITPQPEGSDLADMDPVIATIIDMMQKAIQNRGTAAGVMPIIMRGSDEAGEKIKHITLDRVIDEGEMRLRDELRTTITRGQDLPVEVQTGMGSSNHWCVDDETQVLTTEGWKHRVDLAVGDEVLTLNPTTGCSEWGPVLAMYEADVVDEPMLAMETRGHSSLTTMAHRWLVDHQRHGREFLTSDRLTSECAIPTAAPCDALPTQAKWDDDLVELVAWFGTDGYMHTRSGQIHQSHTRSPDRVDRIRGALTRTFGPSVGVGRVDGPAWREVIQSNDSAYGGPITVFRLNVSATAVLTEHAPGRVISLPFVLSLTRAQLALFMDVVEMADGRHYRQGKHDLWQKNETAIDAYEMAAILNGQSVSRRPDQGGTQLSVLSSSHVVPLKAIQQGRRSTDATYTGVVWCPTTPNGTWLARRNGSTYFTGNSSWSISDSTLTVHLQPLADRFADGLLRVFLRPALASLDMFDPQEIATVAVVADGSNVVTRPNAAEDYRQLHDRITVGDSALREKSGAEEADKPTEEEYVRIMGRRINSPYLATFDMPVAERIDWEKVKVGTPSGAPGVGGEPSSRLPADSGDPAGAPGDVRD